MSEKKYLTRDDIHLRLSGVVLKYKNSFGYSSLADEGMNIRFTPYTETGSSGQDMLIDANSPDLDIASPPLGYMQVNANTAAYVTRAPVRRQKQGLSTENISAWVVNGTNIREFNPYYCSREFFHMLYEKYPTRKDILKTLGKAVLGYSFCLSKSFALSVESNSLILYRTNTPIGTIDVVNNFIQLYPYWEGDSILIADIERELSEYKNAS